MKRQLNNRGGFTLVEIMIVVAIIALLATIAIPNFMRARKRSQASALIEDMRIIEAAKDQYSIEYNLKGTATIAWTNLAKYIKPSAAIMTRDKTKPVDVFNTDITLGAVDTAPTINSATIKEFEDVDITSGYWGAYAGSYTSGS